MSFGIALSGIDAAQSDLNVTANNIANASTVGFKSSNSEFSELFSVSPQGVSDTQSGNGVEVSQVAQQFTQGNIETTGNNLNLALSGDGMFVVSDGGATQFTRAGSFNTNSSGEVVNSAGQNLQVYAPTASGTFNTTSLENLAIPSGDSAPATTTTASMTWNLPAQATPPTTAPLNPADPTTYNQSTSLTVYDSLGAAHTANLYFVKAATPANTWDVTEYIDGSTTPVNTTPVTLKYSNSGALSAVDDAAGGTNAAAVDFGSYTPTTGAAPIAMTYDVQSTTQYGNSFGVTSVTQNGYTTGQLSGVSVSSTGVVQANYTNGVSTSLGQVAIANFADQEALQQVGNTNWTQTYASGAPVYGQAGGSGVGLIQSGSLEDSNVDITTALVDMITAQRAFQANAQMISTENQITQTIIAIPTQG
jgi:flagellar hook protein FlgE